MDRKNRKVYAVPATMNLRQFCLQSIQIYIHVCYMYTLETQNTSNTTGDRNIFISLESSVSKTIKTYCDMSRETFMYI